MKTMRPPWQRLLTTIALAAAWLATSERISRRRAAEDLADYLGEVQAVDAALGKVVDRLRETDDLAPTILQCAGVPIPSSMTGRVVDGGRFFETPPLAGAR